jgi:tetratricopeptide (TPR) repeat protein
MSTLIALMLALAPAPPAPPPGAPIVAVPDQDGELDRAVTLLSAGKPADAIAVLDALNAANQRIYAGESKQVFCARSPTEAILYAGMAAEQKKEAVVTAKAYCYGIYLKGYALIDLNRSDEARPYLERAVALAPSNSQFLGELGEWYKNRRNWDKARELFQKASGASAFSPDDRKGFDKRRALRGLGFILVEEGKLDEAEKMYRDCLAIDPTDEKAKAELDYIAQQKGKRI